MTTTNVNTMITATRLVAPLDTNGNPRRLFLIQKSTTSVYTHPELGSRPNNYTERLDIIDEGYGGIQPVIDKYPNIVFLAEIEISPSEYKRWIRVMKNDEKLRKEEEAAKQ